MKQILFYNVGFVKQVVDQQPEILDGYLLDRDLFYFYDKHKMNLIMFMIEQDLFHIT